MTGMLTALLLRKRNPVRPIILIESSAFIGGNYRCVDYGAQGRFDQGMRMLYETGIDELDTLMHSLLPASQWHVLRGNEKDIAGIFWNGQLQTHSPYLDLRQLPKVEQERCQKELRERIARPCPPDTSNAETFLKEHLGESIAARLGEVLHKLHGASVDTLAIEATYQPAMNRVVAFDPQTVQAHYGDSAFRSRVAWPDQLTLPSNLRPFDQAALYPVGYGMHHVLDALEKRLKEEQIELVCKERITQLTIQEKRITQLSTTSRTIEQIQHIYWTGSLPALAPLLGLSSPAAVNIPAAAIVHLRLKAAPEAMERLYHLYCFDKGFHTFRITHYANYCPQAASARSYPLCVELWHAQGSDDQLASIAIEELCRMGIITSPAHAVLAGVTRTPNLHSMCALSFTQPMQELRTSIHEAAPDNLTTLGIFPSGNHLLLYEVLREMYQQLTRMDA